MKKLMAVAASLSFAAANSAVAQSNVTLYGIVDTGISYYNHATAQGGSSIGMPTLTGELPSRWGMKGAEDIGGGNKIFFVLENGFQPATGALNYGGRLFGRQANVGLSTKYGVLTLGRQMNMTLYTLANLDVIGPSVHSMPNLDPYLANARSDNAIGYMLKYLGFTVGGTYSFGRDAAGPAGPSATNCAGQVAGDMLACRQYTAMLAYDAAQFGVAASYDAARGGTGASAPLNSSAYTSTRTVVGGYWAFGGGKVGFGWVRNNQAALTHLQTDIFFLGATYFITPSLSVDGEGLRYLRRTSNSAGDTSATYLISRLNYLLSKRTTAYASLGYMLNSTNGALPVAAGGSVGPGSNQFGAMVGLQQKF
ncbi:porin [Caballeronia sp. J97]|uniref:porin n=1 Tax=Caballeronia sp. J97 TaxID=2805429 RepID=UPI002AAF2A0B|nr:porin [Caballeronia sp. J97]